MFVLMYQDEDSRFYEKIGDEQIANDVFEDANAAKLWKKVIMEEIKNSPLEDFINKLEKDGYTDINKY